MPSSEDIKALKQEMYDKLSPRRKKFIDKIGFDRWDPFQEPKHPIEIRKDPTKRTTQQLVNEFIQSRADHVGYDTAYAAGAFEMAMGMLRRQDRFQGMFDFAIWYNELMKQEGVAYDDY